MKVCIDIDDYHTHPKWDCTDVIERFVKVFPDIKFTLFVTPYMKKIPITDYPQAIERIIEFIEAGNVEVFLHGLTHRKIMKGEFGLLPRWIVRKRIYKSEIYFSRANILYKKGIKFPWDLYSNGAKKAIFDLGYVLFTSRKNLSYPGRKVILSNYKKLQKRYIQTEDNRYRIPDITDEIEIIYYHGHAQNMRKNGIRESYRNFLRELEDLKKNYNVKFIFCSDLLKLVNI